MEIAGYNMTLRKSNGFRNVKKCSNSLRRSESRQPLLSRVGTLAPRARVCDAGADICDLHRDSLAALLRPHVPGAAPARPRLARAHGRSPLNVHTFVMSQRASHEAKRTSLADSEKHRKPTFLPFGTELRSNSHPAICFKNDHS